MAVILFCTAIIDGFVMRAFPKNALRESVGIYHYTKYWHVDITLDEYFVVFIPTNQYQSILVDLLIGFVAGMAFSQAKYLKKYL